MTGNKTPDYGFQSPLVNELYGVVNDLVLPKIQGAKGGIANPIKLFINGLAPMLPSAFEGIDQDLDFQQKLMDEISTRFTRVQWEMEAFLREHGIVSEVVADAAEVSTEE